MNETEYNAYVERHDQLFTDATAAIQLMIDEATRSAGIKLAREIREKASDNNVAVVVAMEGAVNSVNGWAGQCPDNLPHITEKLEYDRIKFMRVIEDDKARITTN